MLSEDDLVLIERAALQLHGLPSPASQRLAVLRSLGNAPAEAARLFPALEVRLAELDEQQWVTDQQAIVAGHIRYGLAEPEHRADGTYGYGD